MRIPPGCAYSAFRCARPAASTNSAARIPPIPPSGCCFQRFAADPAPPSQITIHRRAGPSAPRAIRQPTATTVGTEAPVAGGAAGTRHGLETHGPRRRPGSSKQRPGALCSGPGRLASRTNAAQSAARRTGIHPGPSGRGSRRAPAERRNLARRAPPPRAEGGHSVRARAEGGHSVRVRARERGPRGGDAQGESAQSGARKGCRVSK